MKRIWIPQAIAIPMLLWALYPGNPYGYYRLLRVVCCAVFAYLCFSAVRLKLQGWAWVLGIMALIYNPLFPLHLTRTIWSVVNLVTVLIAIASVRFLRESDE